MRKQLMFVFAALILASGSIYAQSATLKAHIPFDFVVENTVLPAGTYSVTPMGAGGAAIRLRSTALKNDIFIMPSSSAVDRAEHESELLFQFSGGQYSLWQIWTQNYSEGREFLVKSHDSQVPNVAPSSVIVIKAATVLP